MKRTNKFVLAAATAMSLSLSLAGSASALDITIDQKGTTRFYQNEVLGKNSQNAAAESELSGQTQPMRTISVQEDKDIQIQAGKQDIQIELKTQAPQNQGSATGFSQSEQLSDEQVNIEFPAGKQNQGDSESAQGSQYLEQVRQERQERHEEMVQIRNQIKNQERVLELESRQVKATLRQGAEFRLDPEDGQITVVTPSGQEHVLNHLPDQAFEKLSQLGLNPADELGIETNDEGEVIYQTKASQKRRLFGLFPREVKYDVSLNDVTGEVEANLAQDSTFLSQLLDNLSF